MEQLSFTHVPPEGLVGFMHKLATEEWGVIDIMAYIGPNRTITQPLFNMPLDAYLKLRLHWSIEMLATIREGAGNAKVRDNRWDNNQKRFKALLDAAAVHPDVQQIREAAERLRQALLLGAGEAQTKLKYQQEVDFGRQQVKLAASGQVAADIALLGLGSVIDDIRDTTEALADAIGHGDSHQIPSKQLQAATTSCRATFASVATELAWIIDHGALDNNRARAAKLRAPLEALAARYPAPSTTTPPAQADEDATPAADDDTPIA